MPKEGVNYLYLQVNAKKEEGMRVEDIRRIRVLMFPLSLLYGVVTWVRNWMFDHGVLKGERFEVPVIGIGNITVGGTGKTPMVEFVLSRLLSRGVKVAMLSRGYRRRTRGFVLASEGVTAHEIGDEPMQVHARFPGVTVAVDEKRAHGIRELMRRERLGAVVLDDAFQHRWVVPSVNVLLMDYGRPIYEDWLLPLGDLREGRSGVRRADAVVVTKCPEGMSGGMMEEVRMRLGAQERGQEVFFTRIRNGEPRAVFVEAEGVTVGSRVLLVTGVGRPEPLIEVLNGRYEEVRVRRFGDHHELTRAEADALEGEMEADEGLSMLTTEKDAWRLRGMALMRGERYETMRRRMFYVPMEVEFLGGEERFERLITVNNK